MSIGGSIKKCDVEGFQKKGYADPSTAKNKDGDEILVSNHRFHCSAKNG